MWRKEQGSYICVQICNNYSYTLIIYKVIQQLIYNLALFLFYFSIFIYLFPLFCGSYLVLIRCEVLLVANIRIKLSLVLYLSSIIIQTFYFLLTIERKDLFFHYFIKTFLHSTNLLLYYTLSHYLKSCFDYLILNT